MQKYTDHSAALLALAAIGTYCNSPTQAGGTASYAVPVALGPQSTGVRYCFLSGAIFFLPSSWAGSLAWSSAGVDPSLMTLEQLQRDKVAAKEMLQ